MSGTRSDRLWRQQVELASETIAALHAELEKARKQVGIYQLDAAGCAAERDAANALLREVLADYDGGLLVRITKHLRGSQAALKSGDREEVK